MAPITAALLLTLCALSVTDFAVVEATALPLCAPAPAAKPPTPRIQKVERSTREGVWHLVSVKLEGEKLGRYRLELQWEAQTLKEDGEGTTNSKLQAVETDERGNGEWKVEVRGYPTGKLRARVTNRVGATSEWSEAFDVPWLY